MDFCVARLQALAKHSADSTCKGAYLTAAMIPPSQWEPPGFCPVRRYWLERAAQHRTVGEYREAYRAYYAAGWDVAMTDDIHMILGELVSTAEAAGAHALAKIAKHHLASLNTHQTSSVDRKTATQKRPWWRFW